MCFDLPRSWSKPLYSISTPYLLILNIFFILKYLFILKDMEKICV